MRLTASQIKNYENNGYISPIDVLSKKEAYEIKEEIESESTQESFDAEYMAEFIEGSYGVFRPSWIQGARADYEYLNSRDNNAIRTQLKVPDPENNEWVRSSLELLKTFHTQGGKRAVISGSCAEYDWNKSFLSEYSSPQKPATIYGKCKQQLQVKSQSFCNETDLSLCWVRIFFVYGPYEHPARLVPSVIRSLLKNEHADCSHGNQKRDLLFVEDVASGFVSILENEITGIVNIGSGHGVRLKSVVETIGDKIGRRNLIRMGALPSPQNDPPALIANTKRLTEEVGWSPKFNINTGLDQTIQWWKGVL